MSIHAKYDIYYIITFAWLIVFSVPISLRYSLFRRVMMGPVEAQGDILYVKDITIPPNHHKTLLKQEPMKSISCTARLLFSFACH